MSKIQNHHILAKYKNYFCSQPLQLPTSENIAKPNTKTITDRSVDQSARVRLKLSLNETRVQVVSFIASLSGCQFVSFAGGLVSLHLSLLHGFLEQIYEVSYNTLNIHKVYNCFIITQQISYIQLSQFS